MLKIIALKYCKHFPWERKAETEESVVMCSGNVVKRQMCTHIVPGSTYISTSQAKNGRPVPNKIYLVHDIILKDVLHIYPLNIFNNLTDNSLIDLW